MIDDPCGEIRFTVAAIVIGFSRGRGQTEYRRTNRIEKKWKSGFEHLSTVWCQGKYKYASGIAQRRFVEFASSVGDGVCCVCTDDSEDHCKLDQMTKIADTLQQDQIPPFYLLLLPSGELMNLCVPSVLCTRTSSFPPGSLLAQRIPQSFTASFVLFSAGISAKTMWPRPPWARPSRREAVSGWSPERTSSPRGGRPLRSHHPLQRGGSTVRLCGRLFGEDEVELPSGLKVWSELFLVRVWCHRWASNFNTQLSLHCICCIACLFILGVLGGLLSQV